MTFDIRSIWFVAALCSLGFGFLVLLLKRSYSDYLGRALNAWGAAYLCFGGLFLFCLGGNAAPFLVMVVGRTLGALGFVFEYRAIATLKRQKLSAVWLMAPPMLLFAALTWFTLKDRNIALDLAASNFLYVVLMLRNAVSLARSEDGRRPFVDGLASLSFVTLALSTMAAVVGYVSASRRSAGYDFNSPGLVYSTIVAIVVESVLFGLFLLAVSQRLNDDFEYQATHDALTELYNRRTFEEAARDEVSGAARTGLPVSLFLVGIDGFKRFNEEYGHAIGDFILKAAAGALRRSLEEEGLVCRWSGDEFCVLLPRAGRKDAEQLAQRTLAAFEELDITVAGKPVRVEISIGIATREDNALEFPLLVQLADVALYRAKEDGRKRIAFA